MEEFVGIEALVSNDDVVDDDDDDDDKDKVEGGGIDKDLFCVTASDRCCFCSCVSVSLDDHTLISSKICKSRNCFKTLVGSNPKPISRFFSGSVTRTVPVKPASLLRELIVNVRSDDETDKDKEVGKYKCRRYRGCNK